MERTLMHHDGDVIICDPQAGAEEGPTQSVSSEKLWWVTGSIDLGHWKCSASAKKTEVLRHCSSSVTGYSMDLFN